MEQAGGANAARFIFAYLLSAFGYEFVFFVMTIHVYSLTDSPLNVGIFGALTFIPRLLAFFYGVVVDRYNRAAVFAVAAGLTAVLTALLGLGIGLVGIYIIWLGVALLLTVIVNVRTALMTEIIPRDSYLAGNSLVLTSLNSAKMVAPLLAGLASATMSPRDLFWGIGAMYLMAALVSSRIHLPARQIVPGSGRESVVSQLLAGWKYLFATTNLRFMISVAFWWRLTLGLQLTLFVVYIKSLGGGDPEYGLFLTAIGLGSIIGSMAGPLLVKSVHYARLILTGLTLHFASFILLGLIADFHLALTVAFLGYLIFYATLVGMHSLRDRSTRPDMRGRVYGSVTAILTPAAVVSMVAGGYLANSFGAGPVLVGAGVLALAGLYGLYFTAEREALRKVWSSAG